MSDSIIHVSALITMFREGNLAHPTIKSAIQACEQAMLKGINVELVFVLDSTNNATRTLAEYHETSNSFVRIFEHIEDDLALSRNVAIRNAKGEYVTFLDGDDLWGEDWVWRCYEADQELDQSKQVIWHPHVNVVFENEYQLFYHTDMESSDFDIDFLRIGNYWTSLSFAKRSIYLENPYMKNNVNEGFGFEDWNWNCNTISKGIIHKTVKHTCHFIRKKKNSMLVEHNSKKCLMTPSNLFHFES